MDSKIYTPMWERVEPILRKHLQDVLTQMVHKGFTHGEVVQAGDEEFRLDVTVQLDGTTVGGFEFTLHDGDVSDGEGFAVGLGWFGDEAEVLAHSWRPANYTEGAFTWHEQDLLSRLESFDAVHVAKYAEKDFIELRMRKLTK